MKYPIIAILLFILARNILLSQEYQPEQIENLLEKISQDNEQTPQLDEIEYFIINKIYLADAEIDDLMKLPEFSFSDAERILKFVKANPFTTFRTMADSLNLTREQLIILKLCTGIQKPTKKNIFYSRIRNENSLNQIRGFEDSSFKGDRLDLYQKYKFFYDTYEASLIISKNAGEKSIFDFYSSYLKMNFSGYDILLGDFYVQSGFGNNLWKGLGLRKGSDAISPAVQYGSGITPNNSTMDNGFFRGIGITKAYVMSKNSSLKALLHFSYTPRSGTADSLNNITSIYQLGLYRTENEISKKNKFNERMAGANLEYNYFGLKAGLNSFYLDYDKSMVTESATSFSGKGGMLNSIYTYYRFSPFTVGAELSKDAEFHTGFQSGMQYETSNLSAALHFRAFPSIYRSPYGYMFGETYTPANQTGIYLGLKYRVSANLSFSGYTDFYQSVKPTYSVPYPVKGSDFFLQTNWNLSDNTQILLRLHFENSTDSKTDDSLSKKIVFQKSGTSARFEIFQKFNESFRTRIRIEGNYKSYDYTDNKDLGASCFGEFNWKMLNFLNIGGRVSYYSTDNYESAIWEFEGVAPGIMPTSLLYGNGFKWYSFLNLTPIKNISIWAVYSYFEKYNVSTLGTGYNLSKGNNTQKILLQMDFAY